MVVSCCVLSSDHGAVVRLRRKLMRISRVVPNLASDQPDACREFYAGLLGFQVTGPGLDLDPSGLVLKVASHGGDAATP
jgi:hypothetical protein